MSKEYDFYLVWNPQHQTPPRHRHVTEADAKSEAMRLASAHPGQEFYVLRAVGRAVKIDVEYISLCDSELPF